MGVIYGSNRKPTFYRDFLRIKSLNHGIGPDITFTRTGTATFFNSSGVLTTSTANTPRFDHDPVTLASKGLLIEEARTNSIRNSQAGGSANGVVQTGSGIFPTNWGLSSNLPGTGLSREVIGTGTQNGFSYIDVRFSGTNTSGSSQNLGFALESGSNIAASAGQTWTHSVYLAIVQGSLVGTWSINVVERSSTGVFLTHTFQSIATVSSSLARFTVTRTLTDPTTAFVNPGVVTGLSHGSTIDLTLRIAAPQLERGSFATSYIPTTTAAVTRGPDVGVVTPISSFVNQSGEESMFSEFSAYVFGPSFPRVMQLDQGSTSSDNRNLFYLDQAGGTVASGYHGADVPQYGASAPYTLNSIAKIASGIASNNGMTAVNGSLRTAGTSITLRTTQNTHLQLGNNRGSSSFLNGHLRKVAYWPTRLSDLQLKELTK
jgi:hypothetical protein